MIKVSVADGEGDDVNHRSCFFFSRLNPPVVSISWLATPWAPSPDDQNRSRLVREERREVGGGVGKSEEEEG